MPECEHEFDHHEVDGESVLICCFCRKTYANGEPWESYCPTHRRRSEPA